MPDVSCADAGGVECDRSFTRSDALAKHMRTVHETEALRPSDPIPKSHPSHRLNNPKAKRTLLPREPSQSASDDEGAQRYGSGRYYQSEDGYDSDEEKLPPKHLFRLLKQKRTWAEQEQEDLKNTLEKLTKKRKEAWVKKELLLNRVLEAELGEQEAKKVGLDWV